jgi:hypothetical protein
MNQKLPDPHGMIARVRARLPKNCSVRLSKYCDHIIAMRMQGLPFHQIETWLTEQGEAQRIPATTIWRNLQSTTTWHGRWPARS